MESTLPPQTMIVLKEAKVLKGSFNNQSHFLGEIQEMQDKAKLILQTLLRIESSS